MLHNNQASLLCLHKGYWYIELLQFVTTVPKKDIHTYNPILKKIVIHSTNKSYFQWYHLLNAIL